MIIARLAEMIRVMQQQIFVVFAFVLALATVYQSQEASANLQADTATEIEPLRAELKTLRQQVQRRSVSADALLAPPVDPERFNRDSVVEAGDFRGAILLPGTDVSLRIDGYARFDAIYDNGFVGSGISLFPATIALDQTPLAQRRGKTKLTGGQSRLSFDGQADTEVGKLRGYSNAKSSPLMPVMAGDTIHNSGINLIWSPRPGFGIGLEYDYGERQVRDGTSGENHRVQFAIQFGP